MSGHLDHGLEPHALVLSDPMEQTGLRNLLHEFGGREDTTITLERRGLTKPLIATVECPSAGEATFLIAAGVFAELREYPVIE